MYSSNISKSSVHKKWGHQPVDDARNRTARAKNRRVEVKVFSAGQATAALNGGNTNSANRQQEAKQ